MTTRARKKLPFTPLAHDGAQRFRARDPAARDPAAPESLPPVSPPPMSARRRTARAPPRSRGGAPGSSYGLADVATTSKNVAPVSRTVFRWVEISTKKIGWSVPPGIRATRRSQQRNLTGAPLCRPNRPRRQCLGKTERERGRCILTRSTAVKELFTIFAAKFEL